MQRIPQGWQTAVLFCNGNFHLVFAGFWGGVVKKDKNDDDFGSLIDKVHESLHDCLYQGLTVIPRRLQEAVADLERDGYACLYVETKDVGERAGWKSVKSQYVSDRS